MGPSKGFGPFVLAAQWGAVADAKASVTVAFAVASVKSGLPEELAMAPGGAPAP